jgi:DNA-directed RNA polymerase subunit RPC12/RpoP
MEDNKPQLAAKLQAVHVCENCETRFRPDQVNEDVNVTGVVECKVCSHVGPLRILILPQDSELTDQS